LNGDAEIVWLKRKMWAAICPKLGVYFFLAAGFAASFFGAFFAGTSSTSGIDVCADSIYKTCHKPLLLHNKPTNRPPLDANKFNIP
jgi:hypothetical protein